MEENNFRYRSPANRKVGFELARLMAAVSVAAGHILFSEAWIYEWTENIPWLNIFRFGNLSVLFFFTLSGFVLAPSIVSLRHKPKAWIQWRLIRLLPTYYFCTLIPLGGYLLFSKQKLPNGITGLILTLLGLQGISKTHYLDFPNPPLWSLSVEICCSLFLVYVFTKRFIVMLALNFVFLFLSQLNFELQILLKGLSFFFLGFAIYNLDLTRKIFSIQIRIYFLVIILFLYFGSEYLQNLHSILALLFAQIFLFIVFIAFSRIDFRKSIAVFIQILSARTYSLYASHFPVIYFYSKIFAEDSALATWIKLIFLLFIVTLAAELTYRYCELPSLNYSRNFRKLHA
jgi:peptidoglycan/LPS O-acetylase OafA/YrhL